MYFRKLNSSDIFITQILFIPLALSCLGWIFFRDEYGSHIEYAFKNLSIAIYSVYLLLVIFQKNIRNEINKALRVPAKMPAMDRIIILTICHLAIPLLFVVGSVGVLSVVNGYAGEQEEYRLTGKIEVRDNYISIYDKNTGGKVRWDIKKSGFSRIDASDEYFIDAYKGSLNMWFIKKPPGEVRFNIIIWLVLFVVLDALFVYLSRIVNPEDNRTRWWEFL